MTEKVITYRFGTDMHDSPFPVIVFVLGILGFVSSIFINNIPLAISGVFVSMFGAMHDLEIIKTEG